MARLYVVAVTAPCTCSSKPLRQLSAPLLLLLPLLLATSATGAAPAAALNFSGVRGANYIPSSPANVSWDFLAPDALYDAAVIAREVGWARSELNLNALRFRASPGAFAKDPAAFERNLDRFIAVARANQLRLMPILFDTGDLLKPLVNNTAVEAYLKVVIKAHADDDTVMGYDLCNECYFTSATKDPGAKPTLFVLKSPYKKQQW
jgi:hypothetical protein